MSDGNVTLSIPSAYTHPATHPASMITGLATVATSGKYSDLSGKPSLAKVATSGSYNDLSNRPSIPSTPKAYITQTWSSGTQFYRKWSDGWIEQGGFASSNNENITVNLLVPFSNYNYKALVVSKIAGSAVNYNPAVGSKSTTMFIYQSMIAMACSIDWYACGY